MLKRDSRCSLYWVQNIHGISLICRAWWDFPLWQGHCEVPVQQNLVSSHPSSTSHSIPPSVTLGWTSSVSHCSAPPLLWGPLIHCGLAFLQKLYTMLAFYLNKNGTRKKNTDVLFRPIRRAIDLEFCFVVRQAHPSAALWVLELVRQIRNFTLWSSGSWGRGEKNQNLASSSRSCVDVSEKNTSQNKLHPLLIHRKPALQKPTAFFPLELSIVPHNSALTVLSEKFGTVPQSNLHLLLLAMTTESHCFCRTIQRKVKWSPFLTHPWFLMAILAKCMKCVSDLCCHTADRF